MLGYERDVAKLKSKEAHTTNALAAVSHDLARATEQLKVMELAIANGAGQVGGGAMERQEITDLGAKVKGVEGQIYLIKNRLGADLVKFEKR